MTEILARLAAGWLATGVAVILAAWVATGQLTGWGLLYGWLGLLAIGASNAVGLLVAYRQMPLFDEDAAIEMLAKGIFVDPAELDRLADEPLPRITK